MATPPVLLVSTAWAFRWLANRLGKRAGYLAAFAFYWLGWCLAVPLVLMGPEAFRAVWGDVELRFGEPAWLGILCLVVPLALGYGYAFPRVVRRVGTQAVIVSAALALVNGAAEELLWRGAYTSLLPENWVWALLYPTIGFAVWHFAPQIVFPNTAPGGQVSLVVTAGIVGAMWGWVAWTTGSILWVTLSHVLFDFSGLGGRVYLEGGE